MNLWNLKPNEVGNILSIEANNEGQERLSSLGFSHGMEVQYLYRTALNGPRVYRFDDTVYSLSFAVASKILIEKKNP